MAKVAKFADKVKKLKRKEEIPFETDDGSTVTFTVVSRSENEVDLIRDKYDTIRPKIPTKRVPIKGGGSKVVENEKDLDYQKALNKVLKDQITEMAILFLDDDEKPEGTIDEQIKAMNEVELAGFVPQVFNRGMILSGLREDTKEADFDEEMEEAKN
jgi:hypothetical protein